jgi:chromosome segregation ATPase
VGKLSFDPLEFSRQKPEEQGETLRQIAGLDFKADDSESASIFVQRTFVNREVKNLEAQLASTSAPASGLPEEEQSTADVLKRQQEAMNHNAANAEKRNAVHDKNEAVFKADLERSKLKGECTDLEAEIKRLKEKLDSRQAELSNLIDGVLAARKEAEAAAESVKDLKDQDVSVFAGELTKIEETNRQIRQAAMRRSIQAQLSEKKNKADTYTRQLAKLEEKKTKAIREAKYPIDGLSVNLAGEVLFKDLPLEQASSAQQLRVSVAIGLALNPKLRVLLVRDGSLLDETSRALLLELATEHDAQVWLEQVGTEGDVSVIIEDGMVKA